jgi:hypothetical protein
VDHGRLVLVDAGAAGEELAAGVAAEGTDEFMID